MFFRYVISNLVARKGSTAVGVLSIGLVIGGCVLAIAFYNGLRANMAVTGRADNVVVVSSGVLQTTKSQLSKEGLDQVKVLPGIANVGGELLVSPEAHLDIENESLAIPMVAVRGIEPVAYQVHDQVKVIEGRAPEKGAAEVMIGRQLVGKDPSYKLGGAIKVAGNDWPIVGVFSAEASALEMEIWGDRSRLGIELKKDDILAAVVRASSPEAVPQLVESIKKIRLGKEKTGNWAISEREYYEVTLGNVAAVIAAVLGLIVVLGAGAVVSASNTLHASLSSRIPEFAALWVVGHRRGKLFRLILFEGLVLCSMAALVAVAINLAVAGTEISALLGGELEFALPFTWRELVACFALAGVIALVGTLFPGIAMLRRNLAEDLG
jgi:putative ABC transport system permease protein